MIVIKDYESAKKITSKIHKDTNGKKMTLTQFKSYFAKAFGLSDLNDGFRKENERKRQIIKDLVITNFDDPRITIEVAREVRDSFEAAQNYFKNHLEGKGEGIDYPIVDADDLLKRCQELLILVDNIDDTFSIYTLLRPFVKMSIPARRCNNDSGTVEESDFAKGIMTDIHYDRRSSSTILSIVFDLIHADELEYIGDDGYYDIYEKVKMVIESMIWTSSPAGRFIRENKWVRF